MLRTKVNGRFDTREELEEYVLHLWFSTSTRQIQIARNCEVSAGTVSNIIWWETASRKSHNIKNTKNETSDEKRMLNIMQNGNNGDHYESK
jgi:hypothetical protein